MNMLGLPKTTPTAAITFVTGSSYASIRVQVKQLIYLRKVLQKEDSHWTKITLSALHDANIGWAKQIDETLTKWGLEADWDKIKEKTKNEWKRQVETAADKINRERMLKECHKKERGEEVIKTKTKRLVQKLQDDAYSRQPFMNKNNKPIVRAYIMGRHGMLQCAANFSNGYGGKMCGKCGVEDNENHRINFCTEWSGINLSDNDDKIDYELIFSDNETESMKVVEKIIDIWDLGNGKNCMRSSNPI